MNHIGADVHIKSISFAVVNERGIVSQQVDIPTSERGIVEFVRSIWKPRIVVIEEGTLAQWIKEILEQRGERVVITDPKRNRWIGQSEHKTDALDAEKIARLHYGGYTKEIVHLSAERRWFKELVMYYHDQVRMRTRFKNKLKAKFRQNGIPCYGQTVYQKQYKEQWLDPLPQVPHLHWQVEGYLQQLYTLDHHIKQTLVRMKQAAKRYPEIKLIRKIPGFDWITACTVSALIGDVHRFADKKKLWLYVGLGMMKRESGEMIYEKHLSRDYNRTLKYVFKIAARGAIRSKDNPFRKQYLRLTMEQGILPHRAELTIARSLAATVYGVWKKQRDYDPKIRELEQAA